MIDLKLITTGVIFFHAAFIVWLGWGGASPVEKPTDKKIVVKTVTLTPPKQVVKASPPKPKPAPAVKKKEVPVVEKKKVNPQIAKAQEILSRVKRKNNELQTPKTIGKLEVDSKANITQYHQIVGAKIKQVMRLPESGAVKVYLTLSRAGKVLKVEIISSESEANSDYARKKLPQVTFPNFGSYLNEEKHTFQITLQSEN